MHTKELDMLIIQVEMELNLHKAHCHFLVGPITRLRAKRFKEALNGLVQEIWEDSRKTKMGSNQGLVHVIKAIEEANACKFTTSMV